MKKFNLGLEAIGFQTSSFFEKLSEHFDDLIKKKWRNDQAALAIEKMVKDRFNLNVQLRVGDEMGCCMWPPNFNQNHIFHQNRFKQMYQTWGKHENAIERLEKMNAFNKSSKIDIENGKLYGLFSEMKTIINMSPEQTRTMEAREVAAVFLHEVGHAFTWYENIVRINTTNFVLLELADVVSKNNTKEEKTVYLKKAEEFNMLRYGTADELARCETATKAITVYLSDFIFSNASASGSHFYDTVTCEQMADQFVSRLGGGRYLVTGLDKIMIKYGAKVSLTHRFLVDILVTAVIGFLLLRNFKWKAVKNYILGGDIFDLFDAYVVIIGAALTLYNFLISRGTDNTNPTYDEMKVRIQRVKNDMINRLKNNKGEEDKNILIAQIEACEQIEKEYFQYKPIITILANFVFRKGRDASIMYDLQRDLEEIASNPIFIRSVKLSLMS